MLGQQFLHHLQQLRASEQIEKMIGIDFLNLRGDVVVELIDG
jgi:hypothetical protein